LLELKRPKEKKPKEIQPAQKAAGEEIAAANGVRREQLFLESQRSLLKQSQAQSLWSKSKSRTRLNGLGREDAILPNWT
jgi:hypothetical protein